MFLLPRIQSLHQPKTMITSTGIMIIITTTITITTSTTTTTVKTRTMTTAMTIIKITLIALMKGKFTTKSYKHNCRKFERKNTNFLNLKTYEEQEDQIDLSQRNKSNECINSAQINRKVTGVKWPKGNVAIVGDSIMSGIREELLKTDKHNVKVKVF